MSNNIEDNIKKMSQSSGLQFQLLIYMYGLYGILYEDNMNVFILVYICWDTNRIYTGRISVNGFLKF